MPKALALLLAASLLGQLAWPGTPLLAAGEDVVTAPPLQTALIDATSTLPFPESFARQNAELKQVQQDLHRLQREIAALRRDQARPGPTEVLGGIGYIIGLFGLIAWFRCKRSPR